MERAHAEARLGAVKRLHCFVNRPIHAVLQLHASKRHHETGIGHIRAVRFNGMGAPGTIRRGRCMRLTDDTPSHKQRGGEGGSRPTRHGCRPAASQSCVTGRPALLEELARSERRPTSSTPKTLRHLGAPKSGSRRWPAPNLIRTCDLQPVRSSRPVKSPSRPVAVPKKDGEAASMARTRIMGHVDQRMDGQSWCIFRRMSGQNSLNSLDTASHITCMPQRVSV
jgi:hypothetical protein